METEDEDRASQAEPSDGDWGYESSGSVPHLVLIAVVFEGGLAILAMALGWLCDFSPLASFPTTWPAFATGVVVGATATVPMILGLLLINRYPVGPFAELKRVVDTMLIPLFRDLRIWQFALIGAAAGVGEEILFRGLLQGGLSEALRGRVGEAHTVWIALVVASLVFGLMHPITRLYAILCVLIGLYLGWLWIATGNLLVPIIAHGAYDFIALIYLVRAVPRGDISGP